ncbi:MAG: glycosyl transferase [Gammaproteobacteria bacterium]|nr:glycosyl transferase [Gammaproteobacteria bacterium]
MGDFFQNGTITTLHNLNPGHQNNLEQQVLSFSKNRSITLLLPSLYTELEGAALENIVQELKQVSYINHIVVGLDRADISQYRHAIKFFSRLPQKVTILWNDGSRLLAIDQRLKKEGLAPIELGKGRNVWYCLGYILACNDSDVIALHDCDIITYSKDMLTKLLYPLTHPTFNYEYCKGYYRRIADNKINGRVSRLLITPLIRALKKVLGPLDYLCFLDSFRYPLAGEMAFKTDAIYDLKIPSNWGLELGVLSEIHRNHAINRICQVDIADNYDHKHQDMSFEDHSAGLSKMSMDISKAFFRKLAANGEIFTPEIIRTIKASYYRIALDLIQMYADDAAMNGLTLDRHTEEQSIELFSRNIMQAGNEFFEKPMETPFMPSWNRVISAIPTILEEIKESVDEDSRNYR